jgi:hypothetical protein
MKKPKITGKWNKFIEWHDGEPEERSEELFKCAENLARNGKYCYGDYYYCGIFEGKSYSIQYSKDSERNREKIAIYSADLGVTVSRDSQEDADYYSCRIWKGEPPEDLIGILLRLEPNTKRLEVDRDRQTIPYAKRNRILSELHEKHLK